jgi:hypothetical protein
MIVSDNKTPPSGFAAKWLDASKFGFRESLRAVYCILSFSCWVSLRFDPRLFFFMPLLGIGFLLMSPFLLLFGIGLFPGNFLANIGILDNPSMLCDYGWIAGFWIVLIFLHVRALRSRGKIKWFYLALLLLFMVLSMYDGFKYIPRDM